MQIVEQSTAQHTDIPAYSNQKLSAETQNVEKATFVYAEEHVTKGKLTLSVLVTPSLDHILKFDTAF